MYPVVPSITKDGNKWCAMFGANLQEGIAGFGDSPAEAYEEFMKEWEYKGACLEVEKNVSLSGISFTLDPPIFELSDEYKEAINKQVDKRIDEKLNDDWVCTN